MNGVFFACLKTGKWFGFHKEIPTKIASISIAFKGRTIRKVMGGGGGGEKAQKKFMQGKNAKKKNSCKEEGKEKKFMQKEGPIVIFI